MRARSLLAPALAAILLAPVAPADHPQSQDGRSLAFDHRTGNEWWVEVTLGGASAPQVVGVDARDTGGAWKPLTLRSWGAWAGSFPIEPGHLVQFRARFADGATMTSCEFTHPAGEERCGAPPDGFAATFSGVKGNEWWIQASVSASGGTLARVDARLNGGEWKPLQDKGWGWAASHHAPEGTLVQLRAVSTAGAESLSGCYRWTAATATSCGHTPPPDGFSAAFDPKPGNEWWVEVFVRANEPLSGVDARVVGEPWRALTLRSWGAWAGSFHVPSGAHVEFRARSADGDAVTSGRYAWPSATPVSEPENVWPREGSYVKLRREAGEAVPGYFTETVTNATYTYRNGAWSRTYEGWTYTECCDRPGNVTRLSGSDARAPPLAPTWDIQVGDLVEVAGEVGTLVARTERPATRLGEGVQADAWKMEKRPEWPQAVDAWWHPGTGLVLEFDNAMSHSWNVFRVTDTDAPIATGDAPTSPPPRASWPFTGSYVHYANVETYDAGRIDARLSLSHRDGFWQGLCEIQQTSASGADASRTVHIARDPLLLPPDAKPGDVLRSDVFHECSRWRGDDVIVKGQYPEDTRRNGEPYRARVWWADEHPDGGEDADAWWDARTGLVLRYEDTEHWIRLTGCVTNTDAPLAAW